MSCVAVLFIVAVSFSFLDFTTSEAPGSVESRCRSEMSYYVVLSLGSANQIFTVKSVESDGDAGSAGVSGTGLMCVTRCVTHPSSMVRLPPLTSTVRKPT